MVGAKINSRFDLLSVPVLKYHNRYSLPLLTGGVKCLVPANEVVYEIEGFYQFLPPLLANELR